MEWATHPSIADTMKCDSRVHQSDEKVGQARMFKPAADAIAVAKINAVGICIYC